MTVEDHFQFTDAEIREMRKHPGVLSILMSYHDFQQCQADSIWGTDDDRPQGNTIRKQALYERGRSIVGQDLDVWDDAIREAFGFPKYSPDNLVSES